jgi:DNA-directed RNA polymerase subunit omega
MLHPSYSELMAVANSGVEEGEQPVVQSRYSIVKAAAIRAKQIIDARSIEEKIMKMPIDKDKPSEPELTRDEEYKLILGTAQVAASDGVKPLSVAVEELYQGKVKIIGNAEEISEDDYEEE